jgi:NTE family protein
MIYTSRPQKGDLRLSAKIILISLALMTYLGFPLDAAGTEATNERPKIGLALSGGGARGAAHVGVIKVLEEMGVPIDYIAGTSMGSVVGGLYASGMSASEIEQQLGRIDWDSVFSDPPSRPERSQRRKEDDKLYVVKAKIGVSDEGIKLPDAAVQGQKFDLILKSLTLPVTGIMDFDRLPIPFRAVAMDIATGEEVVIDSGDLAVAMRASMAIPVAFSAVEMDGRLLVDGGAANNLPISVVREMGADIVIAIDISTPLAGRDKLENPLAVLNQLTGLLTRRNVEAQIKTLTDQDILLVPELGEIETMSFDKVLDAVEVGRKTGLDRSAELQRLVFSQAREGQEQKPAWTAPVIGFIRFENDSRLQDAVLAEHLRIQAGEPFDLTRLEQGIGRIYGLDIFESVRYDLVEEAGQTGIVVYARQKAWGTDSLQFGLEYSSDITGGSQSSYNVGVTYNQMPLNSLNGEWRSALQIGEDPSLSTEIYQPLDPAARYFVHGGATWNNETVRLFTDIDQAEVEYSVKRLGVALSVGRNFGDWGEFRVGLQRSTGNADLRVGDPSFPDFDFEDGLFIARLRIDTMDSIDFPRFGYYSELEWRAAREALGADDQFDQALMRLSGAKSWGDNTLIGGVYFNTTFDSDAPLQDRFSLGGFMRLSGLQVNQLTGQHMGLLSLTYQRRLYKSELFPVYTGGTLQMGNTWEDRSDISSDNLISSGTLYLGTDTPIGPVYIGYGQAEGGSKAIYLFVGQPFF